MISVLLFYKNGPEIYFSKFNFNNKNVICFFILFYKKVKKKSQHLSRVNCA